MANHKQYLKTMPNRFFRRFTLTLSRIYIRLFFRLTYSGLENIPEQGAFMLVGNHTNSLDMLAIQTVMVPWVHWVAKKELFKSRLGQKIFSSLGCIPVDRGSADLLAARAIIQALRDGQVVGIFPQGTRVETDQIPHVKPKSGMISFAVRTNASILPVAVSGRFKKFNRVKIVFGKPFKIDAIADRRPSARELDEMAADVMRKVYALIGYDFQPAYKLGD